MEAQKMPTGMLRLLSGYGSSGCTVFILKGFKCSPLSPPTGPVTNGRKVLIIQYLEGVWGLIFPAKCFGNRRASFTRMRPK
jgi:hypothetical protein